MAFKQFPTCHCHSSASLDTASTAESFAAWEAEHESGALTITDHGTLAGARKVYDLATGKKYKGKITPILGLESYFRDDDCPILKAHDVPQVQKYQDLKTNWKITSEQWESKDQSDKGKYRPILTFDDYQKYFHLTMHFLDQKAYETAVRLLSFADARAEKHGKETKPLFGWKELEEIGAQNATFTSSCLIGMIQRHIAFGGRYDIAEAYYQKLRSLVKPGNFYIEVFPHVCDKNWDSAIHLTFEDGTTEQFWGNKIVRTDRNYGKRSQEQGVYADALVDAWGRSKEGHGSLRAVMVNRKWVEREEPKKITDVKLVEGFTMNECTAIAPNGDLQAPCNRFVMEMAKKYGDKILISDDSHFVSPDDKVVQDVKLMQDGNWRFHTSYHRLSSDEAWTYFKDVLQVPETQFEGWIDNSREWSSRFKDFKFEARQSLPTTFYPKDTLTHTMSLIKQHGRMDWKNLQWLNRLRAEINLLHHNGTIDLLPYFFIDEEVCSLYEQNGLLTGPGRGSAAGLLLTYLLGITHVDPLKFGLSMDRFLTLDRVQSGKLPDIDQDLPDRDLLIGTDSEKPEEGWLFKRFGDNVVQISTDITVKLKSAILDVHRVTSPDRRVPEAVARLAHTLPQPPQGISDRDFVFGYDSNGTWVTGIVETDERLIQYTKEHPKEWEIVQKCLGVPRGKSRHACAYVIADEPIHNFIPCTTVGGVKVTQPTAAQVESSGGLKMDFLVVNSLRDIGVAIKLIQERSGDTSQPWNDLGKSMTINGKRVPLCRVIPHRGEYVDIWDLPEDQPVFRSISEGDTVSVFQFGTEGCQKWLKHFDHVRSTDAAGEVHKALDSIEALAAFTALDRPGPLDAYVEDPASGASHNMLVEFARRARGEPAIGAFPILLKLFPETYGVLVYQEQLQKAFQELGGTTAIEANNFRIHVSKKQMKEVIADKVIFMRGAVDKIGPEAAEQLWQSMETFGQYGFNKSHAVCYVVIGYACAWLKHHYPLEWWTAVLRHAKKNELDEKFWRHCGHLIDMPDISLSGDDFQIVNQRIRAPLSLLHGLGPAAHAEIVDIRLRCPNGIRSIQEFCIARHERRIALGEKGTKTVRGKIVETVKLARSALNSGVLNTLIISGAMDSLYPPGIDLLDKLQSFININAPITGEIYKVGDRAGQPKAKVDARYTGLNSIQKFQLRKKVLPAYTEDLFPTVSQMFDTFRVVDGQWKFRDRHHWQTVGVARTLQAASEHTPWPHGETLRLAMVAYVISFERKGYHGNKERGVFQLDIEGTRWEMVKWPDRNTGKLPEHLRDLTGAIIVAVVSKWTEDRPFGIDEVHILQPALGKDLEKSPPSAAGDDE